MNPYIFTEFFSVFTSLFLGFFVFYRNKKAILNKSWLLLSISISTWKFGLAMKYTADSHSLALLWIRLLNAGAILLSPFFLHFVFSLLGINRKKAKFLKTAYVTNFIILALSFTDLFTKGVVLKDSVGYYGIPGPIYFLYIPIFQLVRVLLPI